MKAQTPQTDEYLRIRRGGLPHPGGGIQRRSSVAGGVEGGVDDHPPRARVHLAGGSWLTLRAGRMAGAGAAPERDIAVTIEPTSPAERIPLYARAWGLSARETELVRHLAGGDDTRDVARKMFLSEHTIQDHLKSIFAKTGASSRRALLARATGR